MQRLLVLFVASLLLPLNPVHATNTKLDIYVGSLEFNSNNQNRAGVRVVTDQTSDPNTVIPSLKFSIENLDEAAVKDIMRCRIRNYGANYFEFAGVGRVSYFWDCDFFFNDKFQFDSNKLKFRVTATQLGNISFIDSEIELKSLATIPLFKVDKLELRAGGEFRFQASTRRANLKLPVENVKFEVCLEGLECESVFSTSSGLVDYSTTTTVTGNVRIIIRVSTVVENVLYSLGEVHRNLFLSKPIERVQSTPSPSKPYTPRSVSKGKLKPTTKLRAFVEVPLSAKLGVSFPVTVSIKGSGSASCYFTVHFSTNGWGSYSPIGKTASTLFRVQGGKSVTTPGVMAVNYKGPWGVIVVCTDVKTKAGVPIIVGRLIQN